MPSFAHHLCSLALLKVTKSLAFSSRPRHVRDLAAELSLSPSGVEDILRRLKKAGVLKEKRESNRRYVSLDLNSDELECLFKLFEISTRTTLELRAKRLSIGAAEKIQWMDEVYEFYSKLKGRR